MSEDIKPEARARFEMIGLSESSSQKINRWLEQIAAKRVRLSRKEFLNWFVEKSPENLSNADLNAIVERYYDEEAFLRQLLREMKQAKKDGQPSMELVVRPRKPETKRETALTEVEENSEGNASES